MVEEEYLLAFLPFSDCPSDQAKHSEHQCFEKWSWIELCAHKQTQQLLVENLVLKELSFTPSMYGKSNNVNVPCGVLCILFLSATWFAGLPTSLIGR